MKYIKELREGENVIEHYLCKSRASMKSRNGKTYLSLKLHPVYTVHHKNKL